MPPAEPAADAGPFAVALPRVAGSLGLDATDARPLRRHGSGIFLLPRSNVVVRLSAASPVNRVRAELALRVTGWLHRRGFPAVEPVHNVPCEAGGAVATVWRYLLQPAHPAPPLVRARVLGDLLRELHTQADPPFALPRLDPFARLRAAIEVDDERAQPVLTAGERAFLTGRIAELANAYAGLDFPLGVGLIHNDAHVGNLLVSDDSRGGFVLADWESASLGPREVDLVPEGAPGNRFGESAELRTAFARGYGYHIAEWPGWPVLRDARDLHSLAAYIRTAPDKPTSAQELRRRLVSLRTGRRDVPWRVVD
jgi:Ser/Thr protein kinase RdoA (MazF antagonist)